MKNKLPKILKKGNTFVYIDEKGSRGSINISTGKFVGGTMCMMQLNEHLEKYKQTPEYLEKEKSKLEKSIQNSTDQFHKDLDKLEEVEKKLKS